MFTAEEERNTEAMAFLKSNGCAVQLLRFCAGGRTLIARSTRSRLRIAAVPTCRTLLPHAIPVLNNPTPGKRVNFVLVSGGPQ